jgi:hypothetical protein
MRVFQGIVDVIAHRLGVPDEALQMLRAARRFSGFDRATLPAELVPMNVRQLARGVLNYAILQVLEQWVLPFWVVKQFDPRSPSFTPRSHTGIFMNVTHRDWTGIGNPDCPVEPIVDPRGLVTPFRDGWSIDVWLHAAGQSFFPSRSDDVQQSLVDGIPIVRTSWSHCGVDVAVTAWTSQEVLFQQVRVENQNAVRVRSRLGFAIRPFNPEGVALLYTIVRDDDVLHIGPDARIRFLATPTLVSGGSSAKGDCAAWFGSIGPGESDTDVRCAQGLASAVVAYDLDLVPGESTMVSCSCVLSQHPVPIEERVDVATAVDYWDSLLREGVQIETPDPAWNAHIRSSLAGLLMLCDNDSITPGPFTYHLFWFRDAAYMLSALDRFGYHARTSQVIRSFARRQDRDGYFRSQTGEWDSNGQVLWTVWQHVLLSSDLDLARQLMPALRRGVAWINRKREEDVISAKGLLPPGLSAEHLGVSDRYFWDNFWALAGIDAYVRLCAILGLDDERSTAAETFAGYRADLATALESSVRNGGCYPAGPTRAFDHGAIGTVCAIYPLQLLAEGDPHGMTSLDALVREFFSDDMFFQHFIHSGVNPYLTLQIAHAYLYKGARQKFLLHLGAVMRRATATCTFPEAIHPSSGGGSMGDGHHGWAAAEILSAVRDAMVYEQWLPGSDGPMMVLLGGIPVDWCEHGQRFSISSAPVPGGHVTVDVASEEYHVTITVRFDGRAPDQPAHWQLRLPFCGEVLEAGGLIQCRQVRNETWVDLGAIGPRRTIIVRRENQT